MLTAIAVDDEPAALDVLRNHAGKVPFIDLKQTFLSATEALSYLGKESVQLVFIDIHMPDLSGLEFAQRIKQNVQIIFTTAYPEYALKGFDLAVTDYVLKPIGFSRFLQACELAQSRSRTSPGDSSLKESLFVKDGYDWVQIKLENLLYAEAEDNYVSLVEADKRTVTRMTVTELLLKLPSNKFTRVHKSFVIALSKAEKIEKHQITLAGRKIPVSRSFRDSLLRLFQQ